MSETSDAEMWAHRCEGLAAALAAAERERDVAEAERAAWEKHGQEETFARERAERGCNTISASGPNHEPLRCGYEKGHDGDHSWAALPTFVNGYTLLERAAVEYVAASRAEADRVAETGRASDPKSPTAVRKMEALGALVDAVGGTTHG